MHYFPKEISGSVAKPQTDRRNILYRRNVTESVNTVSNMQCCGACSKEHSRLSQLSFGVEVGGYEKAHRRQTTFMYALLIYTLMWKIFVDVDITRNQWVDLFLRRTDTRIDNSPQSHIKGSNYEKTSPFTKILHHGLLDRLNFNSTVIVWQRCSIFSAH